MVEMEMNMSLAAYLTERNAATLAWIAEDPDNRWAGLIVEDLAHWDAMGIYTVEDFQRHELVSLIWDMYKEVTGCRPRHMDFKSMSMEELRKEADYLGRQMEASIEADAQWEEEMEEMRKHDEALHAEWLAEQPEPIDYIAANHQDGWL